jgi:hypothetical protein
VQIQEYKIINRIAPDTASLKSFCFVSTRNTRWPPPQDKFNMELHSENIQNYSSLKSFYNLKGI